MYVSTFYLGHYTHHYLASVTDQTATQSGANSSGVADPVGAPGEDQLTMPVVTPSHKLLISAPLTASGYWSDDFSQDTETGMSEDEEEMDSELDQVSSQFL